MEVKGMIKINLEINTAIIFRVGLETLTIITVTEIVAKMSVLPTPSSRKQKQKFFSKVLMRNMFRNGFQIIVGGRSY